MSKTQSLADDLEAYVGAQFGASWLEDPDLAALVARVRVLEARLSRSDAACAQLAAAWNAVCNERDAYAKVAADAQEQLARALEREQELAEENGEQHTFYERDYKHVRTAARCEVLEEVLVLQDKHAHEGWYGIRDAIHTLLDACKEKT